MSFSASPADGILGIDLTLNYDPAVIQATGAGASGLAATFGSSLRARKLFWSSLLRVALASSHARTSLRKAASSGVSLKSVDSALQALKPAMKSRVSGASAA